MTNTLLEARQDFGSHWGMSDEGSLFMMLVHPVFTKYSTTPKQRSCACWTWFICWRKGK
jgi:hypothetical protein